jgi:hypothetical protein
MNSGRLARKAMLWLWPAQVWKPYDETARKIGLDRLYLLLSFDCDTPEDAQATAKLDPWLRERGINAAYAVPGEQLFGGAEVYRAIAERGGEFINHGAAPHAEWRGNRYWSITFYNQMTPEQVVSDIQRGHEIVEQVTGKKPLGFRAPHFGHFQSPEQLALQYRTLKSMNYRFSTSTLPISGLRCGPVYSVDGLYEIPLSGTYRNPTRILDSWSQIISPYQPFVKDSYARLLKSTVSALVGRKMVGVLNYYVDPAHVADSHSFRHALEYALEHGIEFISYRELLERVSI